jgi:hypothetical protein
MLGFGPKFTNCGIDFVKIKEKVLAADLLQNEVRRTKTDTVNIQWFLRAAETSSHLLHIHYGVDKTRVSVGISVAPRNSLNSWPVFRKAKGYT